MSSCPCIRSITTFFHTLGEERSPWKDLETRCDPHTSSSCPAGACLAHQNVCGCAQGSPPVSDCCLCCCSPACAAAYSVCLHLSRQVQGGFPLRPTSPPCLNRTEGCKGRESAQTWWVHHTVPGACAVAKEDRLPWVSIPHAPHTCIAM